MRSDNLRELARNPNFISGIYNYCDRWCERCPFTSRCFLYASEQEDPELVDPEVRDIANEKFWQKLHRTFQSTADMITQWAAEAGIDLNSLDTAAALAEQQRQRDAAERDELSQAARAYARQVQAWFSDEFVTEENVHSDLTDESSRYDDDLTVADAIEIIRWYQFFIAAKTFRALTGSPEIAVDDGLDENLSDEDLSFDFLAGDGDIDDEGADYEAEAARMDAHGSAKVALVAIDRTMAAWRSLQISLPEKSATIKPILLKLEGLRRSLEARLPGARDFIRPGLDESLSEFAS